MTTRLTKTFLLFSAISVISACSVLEPYQAELGQGNFIREEQANQLEIGQTPSQVVFLLGTPLLTGEQREERWIYPVYEAESGYEKLIVSFDAGVVSSITRE